MMNDPIIPEMNSLMRCGVFTSNDDRAVIVHDKTLDEEIGWLEYRSDSHLLFVIYDNGTTQNLGIYVKDEMATKLSKITDIYLAELTDGNMFINIRNVTFIYTE